MPEQIKPFGRPTSGLVKSIGFWGAMVFGVHCISLSSSGLIPFSWVASVWPGASIIGLLAISMVTATLHGYTFASIGVAMPRSGADYVLASRVLSPFWSFLASWILVIFSGVVVGGLIAWIPKSVVPALLKPMSILFDNQLFTEWAEWSASTTGATVLGIFFLLITVLLMLLPKRILLRTMSAGFILGLIAWLIILYALGTADVGAFESQWNHFMSDAGLYSEFSQRVELAKAAGMQIESSWVTMTLAGLIMGFWIFYGYYIPTFFSGEVSGTGKEGNTLIKSSLSSILITGGVFILAAVLLQRHVDLEWIAAEGYIANNPEAVAEVAGQTVQGYPWITFYAAILKPSFVLVLFVALVWIYTLINLAQSYFFYVSRIIFAWSFDRLLPRYFSEVSSRNNSPTYATYAVAFLALIGVLDAAIEGPLGTQLTFAFFAVATQIVAVIAIIIFPYKMPREFEACPPFVTVRYWGIPRVTILGVLTLIYLLWMIVASFLFPAVGVGPYTLLVLGFIGALGAAVFFLRKRYLKKRENLDLSVIYEHIPPS